MPGMNHAARGSRADCPRHSTSPSSRSCLSHRSTVGRAALVPEAISPVLSGPVLRNSEMISMAPGGRRFTISGESADMASNLTMTLVEVWR